MLTIQMFDCTSFVFLFLARHSPQAAFGSQGKRFFTSFRMTKGLGFGCSRSGRTICCRRCSALRAVRAAASRSGGPQACPAGCARHSVRGDCINIRSKTIVPHPPPHSFERLLFAPAAGHRDHATGDLLCDDGGWWWTSSSQPSGDGNSGSFHFRTRLVYSLHRDNRSMGLSVRCVQASTRKLPGAAG